jgi:hypothetical protein
MKRQVDVSVSSGHSGAIASARAISVAVLLLLAVHYLLVFKFNSSAAPLVYAFVSLTLGYGYWFQDRPSRTWALLVALVIAVASVTLMSVIVSVLFKQTLFPDGRQIQDFVEAIVLIGVGYLAGCSIASVVFDWIGNEGSDVTAWNSIIKAATRVTSKPMPPVTKGIRSLDGIAKALVALVLTVGTLLVAVKKLLVW